MRNAHKKMHPCHDETDHGAVVADVIIVLEVVPVRISGKIHSRCASCYYISCDSRKMIYLHSDYELPIRQDDRLHNASTSNQ
jgi:hypothetical protein